MKKMLLYLCRVYCITLLFVLSMSRMVHCEYYDGPAKDEYDIITSVGDNRFFLCWKNITGFDQNEEMIGVYDAEIQTWTIPYRSYPLPPTAQVDFSKSVPSDYDPSNHVYYFGEGVFGYSCFGDSSCTMCFLSSITGTVFSVEFGLYRWISETLRFSNGKALAIEDIPDNEKNWDLGYLPPTERFCFINIDGSVESIDIPDFEAYYCGRFLVSEQKDDIAGAKFKVFDKATSKEHPYLYVYLYYIDKTVIISDETYTSRLNYETVISFENNEIILKNLVGDDGQYYWASFDLEGNVIQPATQMSS